MTDGRDDDQAVGIYTVRWPEMLNNISPRLFRAFNQCFQVFPNSPLSAVINPPEKKPRVRNGWPSRFFGKSTAIVAGRF